MGIAFSGESKTTKGALTDRFTNDSVILTAPVKVKGGSELQLPSMNVLTNKTSSQAFFLRVLKVIIQLRDAALLAIKKAKNVKSQQAAAALAAAKAKEDADKEKTAALAATEEKSEEQQNSGGSAKEPDEQKTEGDDKTGEEKVSPDNIMDVDTTKE